MDQEINEYSPTKAEPMDCCYSRKWQQPQLRRIEVGSGTEGGKGLKGGESTSTSVS